MEMREYFKTETGRAQAQRIIRTYYRKKAWKSALVGAIALTVALALTVGTAWIIKIAFDYAIIGLEHGEYMDRINKK